MMNRLLFALLVFTAMPAAAQSFDLNAGKEGEVLSSPICSALINRSDQTIMGMIATASQKIASGDMVKHRQNFRLSAGERMEFCSAGPFYEGRRIELVIRTLIPLFSCKTTLNKEIYLDSTPQPGGFRKLSATCE